MTDGPADFTEVNVNITEVMAHYTGGADVPGGWIELNVVPGYYDLLQLQDGVTDVIADTTAIPVGDITQLRLILGENNLCGRNGRCSSRSAPTVALEPRRDRS